MATPLGSSISPYLSSHSNSSNVPVMTLESKTNTSKRCCADGCKKKLTLTDLDCRCGQRYCASHRYPEEHACTHNFKADDRQRLSSTLVKVTAERLVDKI